MPLLIDDVEISNFMIGSLDSFHPDLDVNPLPASVKKWRSNLGLDAKIITSLSLYKNDFQTKDGKIVFEGEGVGMLKEALELLK